MTLATIARRYAAALFQVAVAEGRLDAIGRDLSGMADLVHSNPELGRVFASPAVATAQKRAILEAILTRADGFTDEVRRLLLMLADRDRLHLIGEIRTAFDARLMDRDRTAAADVVTAVPLDAARAAGLAEALGRATGRRVTLTQRVDPAIIGGVIARVGSQIFDGSVRRQLDRMREKLLTDA